MAAVPILWLLAQDTGLDIMFLRALFQIQDQTLLLVLAPQQVPRYGFISNLTMINVVVIEVAEQARNLHNFFASAPTVFQERTRKNQ